MQKIQNRVLLKKSPIDTNFLSTENGGTKTAIDSYSDGIGIIVVSRSLINFNNSVMNSEVLENGEKAKSEGVSLKTYLEEKGKSFESTNLSIFTEPEKILITGEPCNDGNYKTINDIYIDEKGTCKGNRVDKTCLNEEVGSEFVVNNVSYLVVDNNTIRNNLSRASTLCVSNVSDMNLLFYGDSNFNQDISNWDVSNVINMFSMFTFANSFNQNISSWNVSNVINMDYMFYDTSSFDQNLKNWNVSKVIHHTEIFKYSSIQSSRKPIFN
jgi:surface protein